MQLERVNEMLSNYREHAARCAALKVEIADLEQLLEDLYKTVVEDTVTTTSVVTGMPRGTLMSDPTGRLASMLASGGTPSHIRQLEDEIRDLKIEASEKGATIRYVDSWMLALNEKQKFVLRRKIIDNLQWREIIYGYRREYGIEYSRNGIKKIYKGALERLYRAAGCFKSKSSQKVAG